MATENKVSMLWRRIKRVRKLTLLLICILIVLVIQLFTHRLDNVSHVVQHIPKLPYWESRTPSLCHEIPIPDNYWNTTTMEQQAFVMLPYLDFLEVGSSICVRVVVPAKKSQVSMVYMPFPETPWDSILLDLVGQNTNISIPVALHMAPHANNYRRNSAHVYEADVVLRDADIYKPQGYIEYRDGLWNAEGNATLPAFQPEDLFISEEQQIKVVDKTGDSIYSLYNYLALPLCTSMDAEGRWVRVDDLPFDSYLVPPPDNFDRVWLPYTCRLKRYTYSEFAKCLVDKHPMLHWYGDSNTRRALKKITSLGQWCSQPDQVNERHCLCEDYMEPFDRFNEHAREVFIDVDPVNGGQMPSGWFFPTIAPANKSRIMAFKWDGLTRLNNPPWYERFEQGIENRFGTPQTAIISLGNWDPAFLTMQDFAIEADKLVSYIEKSYSNSTQLVIRTGQYFCCAADPTPWQRKYSRLRNNHFTQYIIDLFIERLGASRDVKVWNVASVAERRPYEARTQATICPSNHVRAEIVDIENYILFNGLCN
ncbi:hypothetical protein BX667DRAFT_508995 [Coemansia mojavensis]|nr:hypothetical protein BX667DRAFT_508995 [Coemansia mojavensis]